MRYLSNRYVSIVAACITDNDTYNGDFPAIIQGEYQMGIIDGSENEKARSLLEQLSLALSSTLNR